MDRALFTNSVTAHKTAFWNGKYVYVNILNTSSTRGASTRFRVMVSNYGVSRPHSWDTPQPVGILWMNDQPDAEISSWQQTTIIRQNLPKPSGIRTHNRNKRAADPRFRLRLQWARHLSILYDIGMKAIVTIMTVNTSLYLPITVSLRCKLYTVSYGSEVESWVWIPTGDGYTLTSAFLLHFCYSVHAEV